MTYGFRLMPSNSGRIRGRACGRTALLSLDAFNGLPSNTRIIDLKRRLPCDSCGENGKVLVSVVWTDYAERRG
jgi:hypothetical protein